MPQPTSTCLIPWKENQHSDDGVSREEALSIISEALSLLATASTLASVAQTPTNGSVKTTASGRASLRSEIGPFMYCSVYLHAALTCDCLCHTPNAMLYS